MRGNRDVIDFVETADYIFFPVFTLSELLYGFKLGTRMKENLTILDKFLSQDYLEIQQTTNETTEIFAEIKKHLKKTGKPIPINDIWIAAMAIENGSTLVTFDANFNHIPGLRKWMGNFT